MKFKIIILLSLSVACVQVSRLKAVEKETIYQQVDLAAFENEDDNCLDDVAAAVKDIKAPKQEITFKNKVYFGLLALWMFGILKPYHYCKEKIVLLLTRVQ